MHQRIEERNEHGVAGARVLEEVVMDLISVYWMPEIVRLLGYGDLKQSNVSLKGAEGRE